MVTPANSADEAQSGSNNDGINTNQRQRYKKQRQQPGSATTTTTSAGQAPSAYLRVVLKEPESSAKLPIHPRLQARQPRPESRCQPRHEVALCNLHHRHLRRPERPQQEIRCTRRQGQQGVKTSRSSPPPGQPGQRHSNVTFSACFVEHRWRKKMAATLFKTGESCLPHHPPPAPHAPHAAPSPRRRRSP